MRNLNFGLCAIVLAIFGAVLLVEASPLGSNDLLGASRCTWGPSYWCSNLTNAKGCNAVRHCIQTVWEKHEVPVDNDGICKICKDMVTQARDQLRSNETMDEMRQVFEGSCKLIPIKLPRKECIKLVDDFIPELVEALSSQMNPDQVCSVAGLCNNAKYDELLQSTYHAALAGEVPEESSEEVATSTQKAQPQLSCGNCNQVAALVVQKFNAANRDDILENVLRFCGSMSTFSDACASITLTHFSDIYEHFQHNLNAPAVCHLSGSCVAKYHQHPEDEKEQAAIDFSTLAAQDDDIPCELCEQLVKHLRDVLVANTTEDEFKQVLQGLCSQSKGFKAECLSIVDQYYDVIYHSLVSNLDANGACFLIGVCPASANSAKLQSGDIRPLLPVLPPAELQVSVRPLLGAHEPKFTQEELINMQLPIDHLMGAANPLSLVEGGELCTICEYALHFIQETLATPSTEDQIKDTVQHVCDKMNKGLRGHCHDFVDMYGDAVIALLIQGLNPREICPKMQMCPPNEMDSEVFSPVTISIEEQDKPTCPLCIFAVEQAKIKVKDNKTKKNIQDVLDHLCSKLPTKLQGECVDFVKTYSKELIDMLITDFTSQEICVDLKLCAENRNYLSEMGIFFDKSNGSQEDEDSESSEIDMEMDIDDASLAFERDNSVRPDCLLCEQIIKMIEKRAGKQPTKSGLMKAMHHSCDKLRPRIQKNCHAFVNEFGEKIADLILAETEPKTICREMGFCVWSEQDDLEIDEAFKYSVVALPNERMTGMDDVAKSSSMKDIMVKDPPNCILCEFLMTKLEAELKNKSTQEEIRHAVEHICDVMPKTVSKSCNKFVEQYANTIIMLIDTMPPREICKSMKLCAANLDVVITDAVIECGVCHGVSMALLPYFKQHLDESLISSNDMVAVGCENLPAKYFQICSEMILIYGQSMLHLAQQPHANEALICTQIGKCFDNEKSGMAFASISA